MDSHSRAVAYLKVLLPLAALVLLSTLFMISRGVNTDAVIPFAQKEIEDRMKGQQVTAPFFSGTTMRGDEIMVTAALARPGRTGSAPVASDLSAEFKLTGDLRDKQRKVHILPFCKIPDIIEIAWLVSGTVDQSGHLLRQDFLQGVDQNNCVIRQVCIFLIPFQHRSFL